jgi:hypothetical protein
LVEIKLSTGAVEHGYKTQLEVYRTAAKTDDGLFLVINVGKLGNKGKKILAAQKSQRTAGYSPRISFAILMSLPANICTSYPRSVVSKDVVDSARRSQCCSFPEGHSLLLSRGGTEY